MKHYKWECSEETPDLPEEILMVSVDGDKVLLSSIVAIDTAKAEVVVIVPKLPHQTKLNDVKVDPFDVGEPEMERKVLTGAIGLAIKDKK